MKKTFFLAILFCLLITKSVSAEVVSTGQKISLDGNEVKIEGYNIDGNNYFKLRDIAAILSGSEASFNVDFNKEKNSVEISREKDYIKLPTDLIFSEDKKLNVINSNQTVFIDEEEVNFSGYLINGNNFFKLRDLGKTIGFYVDFKEKENEVVIKSIKLEGKDLINREKVEFQGLAADTKTNSKNLTITDNPSLTIDDFTNIAKSVVLLTTKDAQLSAKVTYNEKDNLVVLKPLMFKYKGELVFKPVLKISQNDKTLFVNLESRNIDFDKITKNIDKNKEFKLIFGYYLGEKLSENFRGLSVINFK